MLVRLDSFSIQLCCLSTVFFRSDHVYDCLIHINGGDRYSQDTQGSYKKKKTVEDKENSL